MTEPGPPTQPPEDDWGSANTPWQQQPPPPPPPPPQDWPQQSPQQPPPGQWQQPGGYGQAPGPPQPNIQTYLIPAILVTVLCCLPTGIAAIVYASQVSSKLRVGDVAGAMKASSNARMWVIISVVAGLLAGIFFVIASAGSQ